MSTTNKNEEFVLAKRTEGAHDLKDVWKLQPTAYPHISKDGGMCLTPI